MKYIIKVSTYWCGEENTYKVDCDPKYIENIAAEAAYDNYDTFGGFDSVIEDNGYDPETITDEERESLYDIEKDYYYYSYEEFTGTDKEFNELEYSFV